MKEDEVCYFKHLIGQNEHLDGTDIKGKNEVKKVVRRAAAAFTSNYIIIAGSSERHDPSRKVCSKQGRAQSCNVTSTRREFGLESGRSASWRYVGRDPTYIHKHI
ncbi:hypothetical protein AVEN_200286-1 [Araneus ventricosus]|uniref:Uncharacterized protein n=1 Tax=Araneus ventricosus TaxID=182803 RepID=A0A4Y2HHM4_ARAVE|nr:hypothetical protein AVEN_200286-1 [Araneus ventricosus]